MFQVQVSGRSPVILIRVSSLTSCLLRSLQEMVGDSTFNVIRRFGSSEHCSTLYKAVCHLSILWPHPRLPFLISAYNCIYNIWDLSHHYCYLPLSWKSWNRFECAVGGVRHPQHTQTGSNSFTIAADSSNGVTIPRCCRYNCIRS